MPDRNSPETDDRPDASPAPSLGRALRDFLRPSRSQAVVGAVLMVCALLVTLQVQSHTRGDPYASLRRADLVAMLDDLTAQSRRLEAEASGLEEAKRQSQTGADSEEVARREAEKRLDALEIMAGTVAASGPGVRITVDDPQAKVTPEILLNAINELRDAGAEVIEIDDRVRVAGDTWVGGSASDLRVDDQPVGRPLVIEAIGNSATLSEAVRFRGGLASQVEASRVGGRVDVQSVDDVVVDSVRTPRPRQFSRPA